MVGTEERYEMCGHSQRTSRCQWMAKTWDI